MRELTASELDWVAGGDGAAMIDNGNIGCAYSGSGEPSVSQETQTVTCTVYEGTVSGWSGTQTDSATATGPGESASCTAGPGGVDCSPGGPAGS